MMRIHHLETDITQACQLSCVACNHHVPLYRVQTGGPKMAQVDVVERDFKNFSRIAHADVWGALGGEPTLHPRLVEILHLARTHKIADTLEVWTNGIRLRQMTADFWQSFDVLVLSRYEGKLADVRVQWIEEQCQQFGVKLRVIDERTQPNFRTLFEPQPTGPNATAAKFTGCFFRHFSRVLNESVFYTCCCAPHMGPLVLHRPKGEDGVELTEHTTEAQLEAYLTRTEPLVACSSCAGRDTAVALPWREEPQPLAWIQASGMNVDNLRGGQEQ